MAVRQTHADKAGASPWKIHIFALKFGNTIAEVSERIISLSTPVRTISILEPSLHKGALSILFVDKRATDDIRFLQCFSITIADEFVQNAWLVEKSRNSF